MKKLFLIFLFFSVAAYADNIYQSYNAAETACVNVSAGGCPAFNNSDGTGYFALRTYLDNYGTSYTVGGTCPYGNQCSQQNFYYQIDGGCPTNSISGSGGVCNCANGEPATLTGCNSDGTADGDGDPDTTDTDGDGQDDSGNDTDIIEDDPDPTGETTGDPIPQSGSGSGGETTSGRGGTDDMGNSLSDNWDSQDLYDQDPNNTNYGEMAEEKININGQDYQLCWHGGIVSSVAECDYTPPACNSSQVATYYGCLNIDNTNSNPDPNPDPNDPDPNPDPNDPDPNDPDQEPGTETDPGTASSSGNCSSPPSCAGGDAQLCAILRQQWHAMCQGTEGDDEGGSANASNSCDRTPSCSGGDAQTCAILKQLWFNNCSGDQVDPADFDDDMKNGLDTLDTASVFQADNIVDINDQVTSQLNNIDTSFSHSCGLADESVSTPLGNVVLPFASLCPGLDIIATGVKVTAGIVCCYILFNMLVRVD